MLRRILRRAVRFGRQQLELREPFLHTLVPVVIDAMGGAFPELKTNPQRVMEIIKDEEVSFGRTLDRGIELFEEAATAASRLTMTEGVAGGKHDAADFALAQLIDAGKLKPGSGGTNWSPRGVNWGDFNGSRPRISAQDAFKLHDTFGFPIDLTRIMAEERGMSVDLKGYEELMEKARELARSGGKEGTETRLTDLPPDAIAKLQGEKITSTNDQPKYKGEPIQATVQAIWDGERFVNQISSDEAALILNHTNFYAEMGGQVGDAGLLSSVRQASFDVETTRAVGGYILHVGKISSGTLKVGDNITATVSPRRALTQKNHTTTHLANWALREVLGDDIQQKGSLVDPEKLRFDFSHGKSLSDDELGKVETLVNQGIEKRLPVNAQEAPQEKALKINGLRAVFGEKYPPMVRVVSVGAPVAELLKDPSNEKWRQYSIEFCGGTHLANSAEAGGFVITSEESVSKGIRRIVGLTGDAAKQSQSLASQLRSAVDQARSVSESEIPAAIATIQKHLAAPGLPLREKRKAQAAVTELQGKYKSWEKTNKAQQGGSGANVAEAATQLLADASELGGGKLIVGEMQNASDDDLRGALDSLRKRISSYGILLGSAANGKVSLIAAVSDDLIAKGLKAGDWIREAAKVAGGGGGGRPQMAQAGGKDPAKLGEALETAKRFAIAAVK